MKKYSFLLATLFFLGGCSNIDLTTNPISEVSETQQILGYCPTMEADAIAFQEKNPDILLIPFESAAEVLQNLTTQKIDFALIGRKANSSEITSEIHEKNLETKPTYTFIAPQKQMIFESDLSRLNIFTCLKETIQNQFPELSLNFQTECNYDNGSVWFIAWSDMTDDMELLIPVNEKGEKTRTFRNAFLYGPTFNILHF